MIAPGRVVEAGTLVIRDGLIVAAGAQVEIPPDARVEDLAGKTLYPGLIDAYAERPWPENAPPAQGGNPNDQVHPEREIAPYAYDEGWVLQHRNAGITTALIAPEDGVLRGSSALIAMGDGGTGANLLRRRAAQHVSLAQIPRRTTYPTSTMGTVALFRQTVLDARWYDQAREIWRQHPQQQRVAYDASLEALAGDLRGGVRFVFKTADPNGAARAARLARELDVPAMLMGNGREYQCLAQLRKAALPVIVPLDFPKPPKVGDEGEAREIGLAELRHWDHAPANPAEALGAGLTVALTSFGLEVPGD
ncbi:MAG: hypothetical protein KDD11_07305, partial [Acidobacteria bacterium]|nr:hypothetical protein [Acidobacteriota bacterium]